MSAVTIAKAAQGYTTLQANCGSCKHMTTTRVLPEWMVRENSLRNVGYTLHVHGIEKNPRCGLGNFAVKKTARCNKYEAGV